MFPPKSPSDNSGLELCFPDASTSLLTMMELAILCQQRAAVCLIACIHIFYMNVARGSEKDMSCNLRKLNSGLHCASRVRAGTRASGSQLVNREETGTHFGGARSMVVLDSGAWVGSTRLREEACKACFFSVLALLCVSVSGLIIQCRTLCGQVASSDRFSQINSAEQEQDVLASFPGTRQITAAPGGSQRQWGLPSPRQSSALMASSPSIP